MNVAYVTAILEAECLKKGEPWSPKFPGEPTVKTSTVAEVLRAIIAMQTRAQAVEAAAKALAKAQAKFAKKPTPSNEIKVACEKLNLNAKKQWLAFTTKRHKMLVELLEKTGTDKTKAKMANVMAFAAPYAAMTQKFLDNMDENGQVTDEHKLGEWPDLQFPYSGPNKWKFVTSKGEPFEVPDATGTGALPDLPAPASSEEPVSADEPTEKLPNIQTAPIAAFNELTKGLKAAVAAQVAAGADPADHDYADVFKSAGIEYSAAFLEPFIKPKIKPWSWASAAMKDVIAAEIKAKILAAMMVGNNDDFNPTLPFKDAGFETDLNFMTATINAAYADSPEKFKAAEPVATSVVESGLVGKEATDKILKEAAKAGIVLNQPAAFQLALNAEEKLKQKPKAWDELTSAEQNKAKAKYKEELFAQPPGAEPMSVAGSVQVQLAGQGLHLSGAAMTAIAGQFANLSLKSWSGIGALPESAFQAAKEIAQKAPVGADLAKLVKDAGIAVLSTKATNELWEKVGKSPEPPDEAGFLEEIKQKLAGLPEDNLIPHTWPGIVNEMNAQPDYGFVGIMNAHHISKVKGTPLQDKVVQVAFDVIKARFNETALVAEMHKIWDANPSLPHQTAIGVGQDVVYGWKFAKYGGWAYGVVIGTGAQPNSANVMAPDHPVKMWVDKAYQAWLTKAKPEATKPPAPEKVEEPKLALSAAGIPELKQPIKTKFKKISKLTHLTVEQKDVIQALIAQAMASGLHLTKAKKVKKQLGAIAGVIATDFKTLYAPAGVSGIGKKLITGLLDEAIKNPPKPKPTVAPVSSVVLPAPGSSAAAPMLFGMTNQQMFDFAAGGPIASTVMAPPFSSWGGTALIADKGGHGGKLFADANASGYLGASNPTHTFMFKHDGYRARGEVAACRLQSLLGLGGPGANAYIETKGGKEGIVQFFEAKPNLRTLYTKGGAPWIGSAVQGPTKQRLVHSLQLAGIGGWLMGEKDDHGGNFVEGPDGMFHGIDHGQTQKYFDSSYDLAKDWDWKVDPSWGQEGWLEDDKGWPKRMLRDWASGMDVPILPLTHPSFEEVVRRAEEIPEAVFDALWRPYAEGAAAQDRLARYSTVASDKTAEGFLSALQARRKNIRANVANLYAMLARTRAEALKAKGDTRSVKEITDEIKEQIGLDSFAMGKAKVQPVSQSTLDSVEVGDGPGWDESKLEQASHLPTPEELAKWGVKGWDVAVGGDSIKDGRITMRQLGEIPMASFMLDNPARAALQARLPGYASSTPPPSKPADFVEPPFTPPSKPAFEAVSNEKLFDDILGGAADFTGVAKPDGRMVTKVEKYVRRWSQGKELSMPNAANYMKKALVRARASKASADPLIAAAGAHYEKELLRFGSEAPSAPGGFVFKDAKDVPEDQRQIATFSPPADMAEKQKEAKAAGEAAYQEALEKAKEEHKKVVAQAKDEHAAKMAQYEAQYDMWKAGASGQGDMIQGAKMYSGARMPVGVKQLAREGKASTGSTWDGKWGSMWYGSAGKSFEIDLTDAVTALAGVAAGSGEDSKFVIRYNTGSTNQQDASKGEISGKVAAFDGQTYVQFPKGTSKEQQRVMLQHAFKVLGLNARPADRIDHELNYVRKMSWLLGAEGAFVQGDNNMLLDDGRWHAVEPAGASRQQRIAFWHEKLAKKLGYDPRHATELDDQGRTKVELVPDPPPDWKTKPVGVMKKDANGNPVPNPQYKPVPSRKGSKIRHRRFDMTDEELEHRMKTGTAPVMIQQGKASLPKILQGTMMSITERTLNGVMTSTVGAGSPGSDSVSGGAVGVFVYNRHTGELKRLGPAAFGDPTRMIFHPAMFLGTNHYPRTGDTYGSKVSSGKVAYTAKSLTERYLVEIHDTGTYDAESIVSDQIDIFEHVLFYVAASADQKQEIIEKLAAAGITEIGLPKRPVEDVIVEKLPTKTKVDALLKEHADSDEWRF